MPKLTDDDVTAFLDERRHLARIATIDRDGFPRVLPIWFIRHERYYLRGTKWADE